MRVVAVLAALAALAAAAPSSAEITRQQLETVNGWSIYRVQNTMLNTTFYRAVTTAGKTDALWVECMPWMPETRQISYLHLPYLGSVKGTMIYRFDDQKPTYVSAGFNNTILSFHGADEADPFVAGLASAKKARIKAFDGVAPGGEATFDVTGADKMLVRLTDLCKTAPTKP